MFFYQDFLFLLESRKEISRLQKLFKKKFHQPCSLYRSLCTTYNPSFKSKSKHIQINVTSPTIHATLSYRMDISVRTGHTRAQRDMTLVSLPFESMQKEQVCLLMEVLGKDDSARTIVHECELIVQHAVLEAEGDAAERLDSALKEMNGLLKGMLLSGAVQDVHMIIAIMDRNDVLHISHAGRAEGYLIRKGIASQITEYSGGKPTPAFVHIASGAIEPNDMLVFSTQRLLRLLTPAQLAKLAANRDTVLEMLERALETDSEHAALATLDFAPSGGKAFIDEPLRGREEIRSVPRSRRGQQQTVLEKIVSFLPSFATIRSSIPSVETVRSHLPSKEAMDKVSKKVAKGGTSSLSFLSTIGSMKWVGTVKDRFTELMADLHHPKRRKRAHLLLIASALVMLLVIWAVVHLFTNSQRSKTRADLEALVTQINTEIQTADNRHIIGDADAANAILDNAAEHAKQVMDNQSGLFRQEAFNLLERIRSKKEEINNIVRISPRLVANLSTDVPSIQATGLIGIADGEFVAFDKQNAYRVLLNSVEDPHRISDDAPVIDGASFSRFQSEVFLVSGNAVTEVQNGQAITMKTDDPKGWVTGRAISAYLRFLYILSPDNNQIYKYERLNNRYGPPVEYNVNGNLQSSLDMTIDGSVYVLNQGGTLLKLFRGETQPFVIRQAPADLLKDATKLFKVADRNFYLLDPTHARVIVLSDGGPTGESSYVKQYVVEGEQVGTLQDLYVDNDEAHLYVMDDKRIYVIDLSTTR